MYTLNWASSCAIPAFICMELFLLQKNAEYYCYCCCRCIHCLSANGATATDAAAATTTTTQRMRVFTSMGAHKIGKYCNKSHRLCQPTLYSIVVPLHIRCGCLCADTNAIADCICARVCVCLCCSSVYIQCVHGVMWYLLRKTIRPMNEHALHTLQKLIGIAPCSVWCMRYKPYPYIVRIQCIQRNASINFGSSSSNSNNNRINLNKQNSFFGKSFISLNIVVFMCVNWICSRFPLLISMKVLSLSLFLAPSHRNTIMKCQSLFIYFPRMNCLSEV